MAQESLNPEEVVLGEEIGNARLITLNRPRQLNVISSRVVALLAQYLEKWEKEDDAKLVIFKGNGRAFSAGGDLKMFYEHRADDTCLEVVYRMYWLCNHIHTYKKTTVALVHGIVMGGGGVMVVPSKFSVVTENAVFAMPEVAVGLHTDCSFSFILPRLPGYLGEFLALTGSRLKGKEIVAAGLATHFVPSDKLSELEKKLLSLSSSEDSTVRASIEEFSLEATPDEKSILNKLPIINRCFSAESIEEIIKSLEAETSKEGNEWMVSVINTLKRSSPTSLKITLRSIREGRKQNLAECMKKEFRLTMNILRSAISGDCYEGMRAHIEKDNSPKWNPPSLEEVSSEMIDQVFKPFSSELELQIPSDESSRWDGKYENTVYYKH
jgi:3-hydroxyisobutyryl-CoA hydrolase